MSEEQNPSAWDEAPEHGNVEQPEKSVDREPEPPPPKPVDPDESAEIPWEKRYKDMESEFGRRGTKVNELERELDRQRLERLEMQQQLQELGSARQELDTIKDKEESEPDPFESEAYFSDEDKQTMKDFPELTTLSEKLTKRELNRLKKEQSQREVEARKEIEELKERLVKQESLISQNASETFLSENVTPKWRELDSDQAFLDWVNASGTRRAMMRSRDLYDMSEVMKAYMDSPAGEKYRADFSDHQRSIEEKVSKREAAEGLVSKGGTATDRNPREMTAEELWEETPEYTE